VSNADDVDLEHRWDFGNCADERTGVLLALRNCLKISNGTVYFAFHASAENNRRSGAAGALDAGDVVVFG
jgi:hypothetical protein